MPTQAKLRALLHGFGLSRLAAFTLTCYLAACLALQQALPADERLIRSPFSFWIWIGVCALVVIVYGICQEFSKPKVLVQHRQYWVGLSHTLGSCILYFVLLTSFGYLKSLIPVFNPHLNDHWMQWLDIMLHGGVAPSHWFVDYLSPQLMVWLNTFYLLGWGIICAAYSLWVMIRKASEGRTQFFSCFILLWVVAGILLATALASVGPIYYSDFLQDDYSAMNSALVAKLYGGNVAAMLPLDERQLLLDFLKSGSITNMNGISAMPSLHTGVALLCGLHSYYYARRLLVVMVPFNILIFIGSFALGWHYAIDTYVSAICLLLLWRLNRYDLKRCPLT